MEATGPELERAYRHCAQAARAHAKSFYFSARFLPPEKRRAVYAIYAFCRNVDDAVDAAADPASAEKGVERWRLELAAVYRGEQPSSPVMIAWRDLLDRFAIRQELPLQLLRGVLMDTHLKRYETWDELRIYCYRVASVVGLMCCEVFGYREPRTLDYAETLGVAMQLTNILRDVGEDAAMGRIYLPREDLRAFGYDEADLLRRVSNDNFRALMRFEIDRARKLYQEAERGIPLLDRDCRFTVLAAARLYARILDRIEDRDFGVWSYRAHLTLYQKIRSLPRIWSDARHM